MIDIIKNKVITTINENPISNGFSFGLLISKALSDEEMQFLKNLEKKKGDDYVNGLFIEWAVSTGKYKDMGDGCIVRLNEEWCSMKNKDKKQTSVVPISRWRGNKLRDAISELTALIDPDFKETHGQEMKGLVTFALADNGDISMRVYGHVTNQDMALIYHRLFLKLVAKVVERRAPRKKKR